MPDIYGAVFPKSGADSLHQCIDSSDDTGHLFAYADGSEGDGQDFACGIHGDFCWDQCGALLYGMGVFSQFKGVCAAGPCAECIKVIIHPVYHMERRAEAGFEEADFRLRTGTAGRILQKAENKLILQRTQRLSADAV